MLNPPISEQVTQVLHSFWALFGCDIRGTACISWTQNPGLRPPHPLDSSSSSAPRDCWWRPWRFHAPSLERTKSLIIAVISWWWDDDSWWWYWWFYNLIFYQPISLMFTVDASSWASLQKLWRDQYHMCWKYEYLKQPAMVDRSESSYNISYNPIGENGQKRLLRESCRQKNQLQSMIIKNLQAEPGRTRFGSSKNDWSLGYQEFILKVVAERSWTPIHIYFETYKMFAEFVKVFEWFNLRWCWCHQRV